MTSLPAPEDVQAAFVEVLVDEWIRAGVSDVVVSPGSRSTPLLIALAEASERNALRLHVVLDERSAGFFALGLGLASGYPAPVVTTSGTAAVELHPAVVEAFHAGAPMLAVTADRPEELQDCGAPQTVRQVGLFGASVRWETAPGVPDLAAARSWRSLASRSVAEARGGSHRPGPVHLNLAFREPLQGSAQSLLGPGTVAPAGAATGPGVEARAAAWAVTAGNATGSPPAIAGPGELSAAGGRAVAQAGHPALAMVRHGRPGAAPWHRLVAPEEVPVPDHVLRAFSEAGERGLIVAGLGAGSPDAVWELSRATSWPVLADPLSGCRVPGAIGAADSLLRVDVVRDWRPDLVLRLGAPWASKVLNEWLGELPCAQILVDRWGTWGAPDRSPAEVVVASPEALCRAASKAVAATPKGAWARQWALAESVAQNAINAALATEPTTSEPAIAREILRSMRPGATLVVSSSMPVRDLEWWGRPREGVRVLANRGANGIDGVLSTALGVAAGTEDDGAVVALVGDLAFLYDAGALLGSARRGLSLDIVVVDNDGGGIFNFLPQAEAQPPDRFERLWGTPQNVDLCDLARSYGVEAQRVPDCASLSKLLSEGSRSGVRVLVAETPRPANVIVHRRLQRAVEAAVMGLAQ